MGKTEAVRSSSVAPKRLIEVDVEALSPPNVEVPKPPQAPEGDSYTFAPAGTYEDPKVFLKVLEYRGAHAELPRAQVEKMSFSELAAYDLPRLFDQVCSELQKLDMNHSPEADIHAARKFVERLRNNLDVFSSVYPAAWRELRKKVDAVYEALGNWKDLQTSGEKMTADLGWTTAPAAAGEVTAKLHEELLPERRQVAVDARAALLAGADAFKAMLGNPSAKPQKVKEHGKKDSRFFWGGIDAKPRPKDTGIETIRRLLKGQVDMALAGSKGVKKLEDPIGDNEKEFHDLRKRVRALVAVGVYFPEAFKDPVKGLDLQRQIYSLVFEYGELEDRLVAARTAASLGAPDGRAAAEAQVRELWPQLLRWQKDQKINGLLKEYQAELGKS